MVCFHDQSVDFIKFPHYFEARKGKNAPAHMVEFSKTGLVGEFLPVQLHNINILCSYGCGDWFLGILLTTHGEDEFCCDYFFIFEV
jgi:hypothetical protein